MNLHGAIGQMENVNLLMTYIIKPNKENVNKKTALEKLNELEMKRAMVRLNTNMFLNNIDFVLLPKNF